MIFSTEFVREGRNKNLILYLSTNAMERKLTTVAELFYKLSNHVKKSG